MKKTAGTIIKLTLVPVVAMSLAACDRKKTKEEEERSGSYSGSGGGGGFYLPRGRGGSDYGTTQGFHERGVRGGGDSHSSGTVTRGGFGGSYGGGHAGS